MAALNSLALVQNDVSGQDGTRKQSKKSSSESSAKEWSSKLKHLISIALKNRAPGTTNPGSSPTYSNLLSQANDLERLMWLSLTETQVGNTQHNIPTDGT